MSFPPVAAEVPAARPPSAPLRWAQDALASAIVRPFRLERALLLRSWTPASFGLEAEVVHLETEPGIILRGWLVAPTVPHPEAASRQSIVPRGTVVLLHGISSCKEATLPMARIFAAAGYRCLLFDSRGHGASGGRWCSYGYFEKGDVSRWLDALGQRSPPSSSERGSSGGSGNKARKTTPGPVAVWGTSMGGAVALQALEHDPRIVCGIAESTFATLREVAADYAQRLSIGTVDPRLPTWALAGAERLVGFPVDAVRPEETARRLRQPVLMVHGAEDRHIACAYGRRIFGNLRPGRGSRWLEVPGGRHHRLWRTGGEPYARTLVAFLDEHLVDRK